MSRLVKKYHTLLDGVCQGIGDYIGVDAVFIRLAFCFGGLAIGIIPAFIIYGVFDICMSYER